MYYAVVTAKFDYKKVVFSIETLKIAEMWKDECKIFFRNLEDGRRIISNFESTFIDDVTKAIGAERRMIEECVFRLNNEIPTDTIKMAAQRKIEGIKVKIANDAVVFSDEYRIIGKINRDYFGDYQILKKGNEGDNDDFYFVSKSKSTKEIAYFASNNFGIDADSVEKAIIDVFIDKNVHIYGFKDDAVVRKSKDGDAYIVKYKKADKEIIYDNKIAAINAAVGFTIYGNDGFKQLGKLRDECYENNVIYSYQCTNYYHHPEMDVVSKDEQEWAQ